MDLGLRVVLRINTAPLPLVVMHAGRRCRCVLRLEHGLIGGRYRMLRWVGAEIMNRGVFSTWHSVPSWLVELTRGFGKLLRLYVTAPYPIMILFITLLKNLLLKVWRKAVNFDQRSKVTTKYRLRQSKQYWNCNIFTKIVLPTRTVNWRKTKLQCHKNKNSILQIFMRVTEHWYFCLHSSMVLRNYSTTLIITALLLVCEFSIKYACNVVQLVPNLAHPLDKSVWAKIIPFYDSTIKALSTIV